MFGPVLNLDDLNGSDGFRIDGAAAYDWSGYSVSAAGDINGDGFDDVIIGAKTASPNGYASGSSYVVFGTDAGFDATLSLSALIGSNGFRIDGVAFLDRSGHSVSAAGDINGDGIDDLIIGAFGADPNGDSSGSSYVVFGTNAGFDAILALSDLTGSNGFRIDGVADSDFSGVSVSAAGDINHDGIDDLIIGAQRADPNGYSSGASYVVFGSNSVFEATFALSSLDGINGINGFRIDGEEALDESGTSVSAAGDINGDGIDDLIIGATRASPNGAGSAYVVFGTDAGFGATLALSSLDGGNGFRIDGVAFDDTTGVSVSEAGDINGDGIGDLIIGAPNADPNGGFSGSSYVVFGSDQSFAATFDLSSLDGNNGFRIDGVAPYDFSGVRVSSAGDINGDGFDDLIVGAYLADPNGYSSGASYIVYGKSSFVPTLNLSSLDGSNGFRIYGVAAYDLSGLSVSAAGDLNGDGIDDLIIGAPGADANGSYSGASYVIFGQLPSNVINGTPDDDLLIGTGAPDSIFGFGGDDSLSGLGGNDTLNGDDGDDTLEGGDDNDTLSGGADNDTLRGGDGSDVLDGGSGNDVLAGDTGDDSLSGGDGDDSLKGGLGADILDGGAGSDTVTYEDAQSSVQINLQNSNQLGPFEGPDTFISIENVTGSNFNDSLNGDAGDNVLSGGGGNDFLTGFAGNDTLLGGAGNEIFMDGGAGDDIIDGGDGTDQVTYAGAGSSVTVNLATGHASGGLGNDTLNAIENVLGSNFNDNLTGNDNNNSLLGQGGDDVIAGKGGDDVLNGGIGNDTLQGGGGNDTLVGGPGNDTLDGGAGTDTASYATGGSSGVIASLTTGQTTGGLNTDTLSAVENLIGTNFIDTLTGDAKDNRLSGGGGNDLLIGEAGGDTLLGDAGSDTLVGGAGDDTLDGGVGTDTASYATATGKVTVNLNLAGPQHIGGGQGNDTFIAIENLTGSNFNDTLTGNAADNVLSGGDGNDTLIGGDGNDSLFGGAGNDSLDGGVGIETVDYSSDTAGVKANLQSGQAKGSQIGTDSLANVENVTSGSGDDQLTGDQNDNVLNGGDGDDKLVAHAGNDTLIGGGGNDELKGGSGIDTASYESAAAAITVSLAIAAAQNTGGAGTDILEDIENLIGGSGGDHLFGNQKANVIIGGAGDDELRGAAGNDTLIGGDGADTVKGGAGADTLVLTHSGSVDSIIGYEFSDGDIIDLSALLDGLLINDDASNLAEFVRLRDFGGEHLLQINIDGSFGSDLFVTVATFDTAAPIVHMLYDGEQADVLAPPPGSLLYLADLDGSNGFRIDGITAFSGSGYSVSDAGDINGDGFDDVVIGAFGADPYGASSYVVFGTGAGFQSTIALSSLDGTNGFSIDGSAFAEFGGGRVVSAAGDVNSDGLDDLFIGSNSGSGYVVFGTGAGFLPELDLSSLDGSNGFRIVGDPNAGIGHSVSAAGDVNGDGFGDLIIGVTDLHLSGTSYVVFGSDSGFPPTLLLLDIDGGNGFLIEGASNYDSAGLSLSSAGDFNGDGFDDLIIGAPNSGINGFWSGASYIVFGTDAPFDASLDLAELNGADGFQISGTTTYDRAGFSVSGAGDVNGDGFDDVIIGAFGSPNGNQYGSSYVVFGSDGSFDPTFDLSSLNGSNGFRLDGQLFGEGSGFSVSGAGDFNGDGFDDLIVGAPYADPNGTFSGVTYLVFGSNAGFPSVLALSSLDGTNGFRIEGTSFNARAGTSVSAAGDVNGDGFDDLIVGAVGYSGSDYGSGASFVILGHTTAPVADRNVIGTPAGESVIGGAGNDTLLGNGGADSFEGGAGNDIIYAPDLGFLRADGGNGNDMLVLLGSGASFDFSTFADNKIRSIETIDVSGSGDNTLRLGVTDVLNLPDGRNVDFSAASTVAKSIVIEGNLGDTLQLGADPRGEWTLTAENVNLDGSGPGSYDVYVFDQFDPGAPDLAALAVQASMSVFLL